MGNIRIAASGDGHNLDPAHAATTFYITPFGTLITLLPFLLLMMLAGLAAKQNRSAHPWGILVPVVLLLVSIHLVFDTFPHAMGAGTGALLSATLQGLILGFASVHLLMGGAGPQRHGFARWFLAFLVTSTVGVFTIVCVKGVDSDFAPLLIYFAIASFALITGIAITNFFLRERFSYTRLNVYVVFATFFAAACAFAAVLGVTFLLISTPAEAWRAIPILLIFSFVLALIVGLILLPFAALAHSNSFYDLRVRRLLGVRVESNMVPPPLPLEQKVEADS